jgi:hypothetical protein
MFTQKVAVCIEIHQHKNRVKLLFDNTKDASRFAEHFEGI